MLFFKKYDSSLNFDLKSGEVFLKIYFKTTYKFKLVDVSLSVEESNKSNEMEYCLSTPKGKFYIPKNTIINTSNKFRLITEIFESC